MSQNPTVIGLIVCEKAIIEEGTKNVSLINCFTRYKVEAFPSEGIRFAVYVALTDGLGDIPLALAIRRLDTGADIFRESRSVHFADRLQEVRFLFRVTRCGFPVAGPYDVILFAGDAELARHRIRMS